jgi:nucleoside-diphosphate-sugar epimerase
LLKAAARENTVVLGATGTSISNKDLALEIAKSIPGTQIEFTGTDSTPSSRYDITETRLKLDWTPRVPFSESLKEYIENDLADL